jgi:hypothetical protein
MLDEEFSLIYRAGPIVQGGVLVGARRSYVSGKDGDPRIVVQRLVRYQGRLVALKEIATRHPPTPEGAEAAFEEIADGRGEEGGHWRTYADAFGLLGDAAQRNVVFWEYNAFREARKLGHSAGDDVFEAVLVRQREALAPFMETVDGRAIEAACILARRQGDHNFAMDMLRWRWADLDRAGGPESPLTASIRAYPGLAATLVKFWREEPLRFSELPTREVALAALLKRGRSFDPRDGSGARRSLSQALAMRIVDEAANLAKASDNLEGSAKWHKFRAWDLDDYPDHALGFFVGLLSRLPLERTPEGPEEWQAFERMAPLVEWVMDGVPDGLARTRLNAPERWAAFRDACLGVDPVWPPGLRMRARPPSNVIHAHAARDFVVDFFNAFRDQVVLPAIALSRGAEVASNSKDEAYGIARAILFDERPLATLIAEAKEWRRLRSDMEVAVSANAPLRPSVGTWAPVFPDAAYGDLAIVVLTPASELVDEGASRPDPNGIDGLDNPLLQNAEACRAGWSRIVSLRRVLPNGRFERLAAAEVKIKDRRRRALLRITRPDGSRETIVVNEQTGDAGVEFGQRWGRHNRTAPTEACALFVRYVAELGPISLPIGEATAAAAEDTISEGAGYDVFAPEAFQTAMSAWAPFLTAPQRDMSASNFADMLEGGMATPSV